MTRLLLLPALLVAPMPALAEVCDKAFGDDWRPEQGPISWPPHRLSPGWIAAEGWKLVAVALVLAVLLARETKGLVWIGAAMLTLAAAHSMLIWGLYRADEPGLIAAAIREGCLPSSLLVGGGTGPSIGLPIAWAVAATFILYSRRHRHAA